MLEEKRAPTFLDNDFSSNVEIISGRKPIKHLKDEHNITDKPLDEEKIRQKNKNSSSSSRSLVNLLALLAVPDVNSVMTKVHKVWREKQVKAKLPVLYPEKENYVQARNYRT